LFKIIFSVSFFKGENMDIGVINEQTHFESRVAVTPMVVENLCAKGNRVFIEKGAGGKYGIRSGACKGAGA